MPMMVPALTPPVTTPRRPAPTPEQVAEFRGLFFGEGHIDMMKSGRAQTLTPRVRLAVRDDDRAVVEWCRDLFGGSICSDARTRSVCWSLTGRKNLTPVVDCLLGGSIPSKKRDEVVLLAEALTLVGSRWHPALGEIRQRQHAIRDQLKARRAYKQAV